MLDATHGAVPNIPLTTTKIAGYVTGSGGIAWIASDWQRFPHAGLVRIDQDAAASVPSADVLDVENGAATPSETPGWVRAHGPGATIYGTDGTLAACATAAGLHADCWLADWNLNQAAATALIGTTRHGMVIRAVQWASPTSNPRTLVPGSTLNLAAANVDLSVADITWHPAPVVTPPAAPHLVSAQMVAHYSDGSVRTFAA